MIVGSGSASFQILRYLVERPLPTEWRNVDDPEWAGGTVLTDDRRMVLAASPAACWLGVVGIGGNAGWYYGNWFWKLRGAMDRLIGGPGVPILSGPEPQPRTGQA